MVAARLTLDPTGNWAGYLQKTSGTTQLNQSRTHSVVNESTDITETVGTAWATPVHDAAGNMTTAPKPSSLASGLTCKYDAWNRLVEVTFGATTLAKHRYDGLRRRIDRTTFVPVAFRHNHTYYNASWQILEIRQVVGETGQPEAFQPTYQYVWSARYIDAPVLQDYNSDQDGLCDDSRLYYLSDANFNVTTLLDTSGDALEHYVYDPYGKVTAYKGDWTAVQYGFPYGFRFGYTGRECDLHTGLYHYRHRYYHAELGRFLSRDLIGYAGGDVNLYRYVGNGPLYGVDPYGLDDLVIVPENPAPKPGDDAIIVVHGGWKGLIIDRDYFPREGPSIGVPRESFLSDSEKQRLGRQQDIEWAFLPENEHNNPRAAEIRSSMYLASGNMFTTPYPFRPPRRDVQLQLRFFEVTPGPQAVVGSGINASIHFYHGEYEEGALSTANILARIRLKTLRGARPGSGAASSAPPPPAPTPPPATGRAPNGGVLPLPAPWPPGWVRSTPGGGMTGGVVTPPYFRPPGYVPPITPRPKPWIRPPLGPDPPGYPFNPSPN